MRLVAAALGSLVIAAPAVAAKPIRIGAVFSLTGAAEAYSRQQQQGAQLAIAHVNRSGALKRRLTLRVLDDGSDAATATRHFGELIDSGVVALLGPTLSTAALQADRVAQEQGIPVLGVSNTAAGITAIGEFVFRDSLPEAAVQPQTIRVTQDALGYTRAAIVWATPDAYSQTGHDVFAAALAAEGVSIAADASFASADPEAYRAAVDQAAAAQPQALVISALAPDVAKVMRYARSLPALADVPFIGGNAFNAPGLAAAASGAAEGAICGAAWIASRRTPGNRAFVRAFRKRYGSEPDQFAAQAYTGVHLLAEAIRREGARPSAIRRGLAGIRKLPTILGRFSFTADREPVYDPVVVRITGTGYEPF